MSDPYSNELLLVRLILEYVSAVWDPYHSSLEYKAETVKKRTAKRSLCNDVSPHTCVCTGTRPQITNRMTRLFKIMIKHDILSLQASIARGKLEVTAEN